MSVKIRKFRNGGWEVDINRPPPERRAVQGAAEVPDDVEVGGEAVGRGAGTPDPARRPPKQHKEVPTLSEFSSRFLDGYARANRQKPSGIAAKETILDAPGAVARREEAGCDHERGRAAAEAQLQHKAPKTVNNVLTVSNVLLKKAVEWDVIECMPCTIRLLPSRRPRWGSMTSTITTAGRGGAVGSATRRISGAARRRGGLAVRRDDGAGVEGRGSRKAAAHG